MRVPPLRIPVPVFEPSLAPAIFEVSSSSSSRLSPRRDIDQAAQKPKATTIAIAAVVSGLLLLLAAVILIRTLRIRHPNPKYIPTRVLKRLWTDWKVPEYRKGTKAHAYEQTRAEDDFARRNANPTTEDGLADTNNTTAAAAASTTTNANGGVDRNTSVRSVMTLPVYRPRATENEQVLGREGERDGIDVVVEMPTAEDEEALREEEMSALYQIRVARRRQIAEREERRRLRREAREANNVVALQELRNQTRASTGRNTDEIEELRQEHERIRETRQRAVSSVSYADLGVARADGTRIRANSTESERIGLLSDAASIGQQQRPGTGETGLLHRRDRSASSVISIDTLRSHNELGAPESPAMEGGSTYSLASLGAPSSRVRSRTNSVNTPRVSITASSTRAGSSPEMIDASAEDSGGDLGDHNMPPPPGYDDVSLDETGPGPSTPSLFGGISGRNSPYNEPPPDYDYPIGGPGPAQSRTNRLSAHMEDLAIHTVRTSSSDGDERQHQQRSSPQRGVGGTPQLPSLRLSQLPQIVIDPSSARP
ncbi:hypothetical protein B0H66DRAFT_43846 [Apodospora peruviana]|uniref:Uncharacterized protein n=1 Tax=Apodospora peruviana TaxID=516989 RepID=A0AAE0IRY2_9PEZI|nr:hypothetical protein B0H66DRAFT_43846 [Apodospora peruviana]